MTNKQYEILSAALVETREKIGEAVEKHLRKFDETLKVLTEEIYGEGNERVGVSSKGVRQSIEEEFRTSIGG